MKFKIFTFLLVSIFGFAGQVQGAGAVTRPLVPLDADTYLKQLRGAIAVQDPEAIHKVFKVLEGTSYQTQAVELIAPLINIFTAQGNRTKLASIISIFVGIDPARAQQARDMLAALRAGNVPAIASSTSSSFSFTKIFIASTILASCYWAYTKWNSWRKRAA